MQKTYQVNLRGLDTTQFWQNPIVLLNWNWADVQAVLGRAIDVKDDSVTIEYMDGVPKYPHYIAPTFYVNNYTLRKELIGLSVITTPPNNNLVS